jgi:hypothetical protein
LVIRSAAQVSVEEIFVERFAHCPLRDGHGSRCTVIGICESGEKLVELVRGKGVIPLQG